MQDNWRDMLEIRDEKLSFKRIQVIDNSTLIAFFSYACRPDANVARDLEAKLRNRFPTLEIQLVLSSPKPADGPLEGKEKAYLLDAMKKTMPTCGALLRDADIVLEDRILRVYVASGAKMDVLRQHDFSRAASALTGRLYGETLRVTVLEKEENPQETAPAEDAEARIWAPEEENGLPAPDLEAPPEILVADPGLAEIRDIPARSMPDLPEIPPEEPPAAEEAKPARKKGSRKKEAAEKQEGEDPLSQEQDLIASILSRGEKEKEKAKSARQVLFGKTIHGETEPIAALSDASGRVVIEGDLIETEIRDLKGGGKLALLSVTDYTGSILCKVFLRVGKTMDTDALKKGIRLRIRGDCSIDTYSREKELNLLVNDIMLLPSEERTDDSEEKRVELHLHTQMSTMDAVTGVDTLIQRAADWGHEAIAITDHGVVQAFPLAFDTIKSLKKKGKNIKLIPGMEGYLVDDDAAIVRGEDDSTLADLTYVVLDVETTGLDMQADEITEIAAVKYRGGEEIETFTTLVNPGIPIPETVVKLTGITDEMVLSQPKITEVMPAFADFMEGSVLCAHNASFDYAFISRAAQRVGKEIPVRVVDTLALSRALLPHMKSHRLNLVCKELGVILERHHRALSDTRATGEMFLKLLEMAESRDCRTLRDLNGKLGTSASKGGESYHIVILAKNQEGMENLYRLVSYSHLNYFYKRPRIPRSVLSKYREGLILGSACESGELFRAMVAGKSERELERIASFYDYLEIQPTGNNAFMIREGQARDEEELREYVRRIVRLGKKLDKPVAATCDVHFIDPQDAIFRAILEDGMGFENAENQPPLYFRTTREMLDEFAFLGEEEAYRAVVTVPRQIAAQIGEISMFPKHPRNEETFQPTLPGAEDAIRNLSYEKAHRIYGDPLPEIVEKRLERELGSILGNGFGTLYYSAHLLVKKSNSDGYLVGSRGSVGSSFVATMTDITEVNPLPPHYVCPNCQFSDFDVDKQYLCGVDLPERNCPVCGTPLKRDGHDIPFEVFLGFNGDKVPDIDLNFSGVYQPRAHKYVEELYGKESVFRAGTIGTLAEKTAYGYVMKYLEKRGLHASRVEIDRLTRGVSGVKRTTGQHPGGMVVVPKEYRVTQFTPVQHPADDPNTSIITTHYEFGSLHDILVKLDILGHDDPTMIHMLEELTGIKASELPLNDPAVMSLFSTPEALGVTPDDIHCPTGTLGIPEFGTQFVRQMLVDTKPSTMGELVRISGLSHGTNVWLNNAQDLIASGQAKLMECFCTRDDIMNYLIRMGVEPKTAFFTMENVRKGRKLTPDMEKAMKDAGVPQYYIDSCNKIGYMFPRAHAVAYVTMALRVAWFKINRPLAYYASYFTVRADEFDISLMCQEPPQLLRAMDSIRALGKAATARDDRLMVLLEIVYEMRMRGFEFLPLDLYKSAVDTFTIEDGKIRPPLNRLPGVGQAAAEAIGRVRRDGPFLSVEDLRLRSRVSGSVIEMLRSQGALKGLQETSQVSLFSILEAME
ncbi:MAG: PolC-type DNA polymerase III [Clostridia bacterium]|nr:PolC-type DNA polymerase III [Clostridia bacterium]